MGRLTFNRVAYIECLASDVLRKLLPTASPTHLQPTVLYLANALWRLVVNDRPGCEWRGFGSGAGAVTLIPPALLLSCTQQVRYRIVSSAQGRPCVHASAP